MLNNTLTGLMLIVLTCFIHTLATKLIVSVLNMDWSKMNTIHRIIRFDFVIVIIVIATLVEAWLWAVCLLANDALPNIESALYFSMVTYTTLGYGDIVLAPSSRLLSAFAATNGMIIFGWSTAIVVTSLQKIFQSNSKNV
ncbi:potassium channel family protein [Carboxylicivirga taeanensis]|uniref:potassium channel family protein n=1 Tax=Carboxylicivirga taeanensis TaxID=1416875 RepID=UPI003F6DC441